MSLSRSTGVSSRVRASDTGRHRDVTREQILDAAERLFIENGFRATSAQEIAAAAGYSTGAIYSSFSGKDELFLTIFRRRTEQQVAVWQDTLESVTASADAAEAMGRALAVVTPEPAWFAVLFEFLSYAARDEKLSRETAEIFGMVTPRFASFLGHVASSSPLPVDRLAPIILALMRGLSLTSFVNPDSADPRLFPDAVAVLLGGTSTQSSAAEAADS